MQFNWIKHIISLWLYNSPCRSCHVVTCLCQSVSCLKTVEVQGCLFHKFNEHYLISHSYLTCQNEFRDTFTNSPVPNKSIKSCLVNHFCDTGTLHRVASNMRKSECMHRWMQWIFPTLNLTLFFVFWFKCNLFFDK
jgi:hypothetical protein